jgi:hypothetical protein
MLAIPSFASGKVARLPISPPPHLKCNIIKNNLKRYVLIIVINLWRGYARHPELRLGKGGASTNFATPVSSAILIYLKDRKKYK